MDVGSYSAVPSTLSSEGIHTNASGTRSARAVSRFVIHASTPSWFCYDYFHVSVC